MLTAILSLAAGVAAATTLTLAGIQPPQLGTLQLILVAGIPVTVVAGIGTCLTQTCVDVLQDAQQTYRDKEDMIDDRHESLRRDLREYENALADQYKANDNLRGENSRLEKSLEEANRKVEGTMGLLQQLPLATMDQSTPKGTDSILQSVSVLMEIIRDELGYPVEEVVSRFFLPDTDRMKSSEDCDSIRKDLHRAIRDTYLQVAVPYAELIQTYLLPHYPHETIQPLVDYLLRPEQTQRPDPYTPPTEE